MSQGTKHLDKIEAALFTLPPGGIARREAHAALAWVREELAALASLRAESNPVDPMTIILFMHERADEYSKLCGDRPLSILPAEERYLRNAGASCAIHNLANEIGARFVSSAAPAVEEMAGAQPICRKCGQRLCKTNRAGVLVCPNCAIDHEQAEQAQPSGCSTCGRTKEDPAGVVCSNPFHLTCEYHDGKRNEAQPSGCELRNYAEWQLATYRGKHKPNCTLAINSSSLYPCNCGLDMLARIVSSPCSCAAMRERVAVLEESGRALAESGREIAAERDHFYAALLHADQEIARLRNHGGVPADDAARWTVAEEKRAHLLNKREPMDRR